ncbi:C5a anaphylatoxin chemotactic receptor 1-like [Tubulanus polymorphus]|uniref:C5a anaphylatoxin chemotactic receptor 1-like n=1 Tax=Tubulanus polymorphus TaxID=672921 RepID=UPI003DA34C9D
MTFTTTTGADNSTRELQQLSYGRPFIADILLNSIVRSYGHSRIVLLSFLPLVFIVGAFGNVASVLVMSSHKFRRYSYANYAIALSVSDLMMCSSFAGFPLLQYVLVKLNNLDGIRFRNAIECTLYDTVFLLFAYCSTWLVVAVSVERLAVVVFPFTAPLLCTPRFSRVVIICIFLVNVVICLATNIDGFQHSEVKGCYTIIQSQQTTTDSSAKFLVIYMSLLPFSIIATSNTIIVFVLNFNSRQLEGKTRNEVKSARAVQTTKMLLAVSVVFLVTMVPHNILVVWATLPAENADLIVNIFGMFRCCNYAVNFFIYILVGKDVRSYVRLKVSVAFHCTDENKNLYNRN